MCIRNSLQISPLYLAAGRHYRCRCLSWRCCVGCGASSSACWVRARGVEGDRWGFGSPPVQCSQHPCSWEGVRAFWEVQPFFGFSWRKGQMFDGPPLEPGRTRTHLDLAKKRFIGLYVKNKTKHLLCYFPLVAIMILWCILFYILLDAPFPPISWLLLSPPSSWCPAEDG